MLEAGWVKVFHPGAAVRHAHDYGVVGFMRRYFDEYRGLREVTGHVEPMDLRAAVSAVRADARWVRDRELPARDRARWLFRSAIHQGGRRVASALGSRANRVPDAIQRTLSMERRAGAVAAPADPLPRGRAVSATPGPGPQQDILRLSRDGPVPLDDPVPGMSDRPMHVATIIPPFMRGSGGHSTIFRLIALLEELGHTCSIWMYDPHGHERAGGAVLRRRVVQEFVPLAAPVHRGFDDWTGADVTLATGWDTAYASLLLPACRARAYLIQDHEPEFFPTSAESRWAADTYELGLYGIAASRWLHDLLARRYGQRGTWFRLGVDRAVYRPRPVERRRDTVIFYARGYTARRAVPLGKLALEELHRRRPGTRFVLFGQAESLPLPFEYELLGVTCAEVLAWHYSAATVGLCLSLTNVSLIPQEMLACGLPCVDLAGGSTDVELGRDGGVEIAEADPVALADGLERLLEYRDVWERRSRAGLGSIETASWEVAARQVEGGLRQALREREGL
jgi:glycosyltransferase involved in cell wall biosynthesis